MSNDETNLAAPNIEELEQKKQIIIIKEYYKNRVHYGHHPNQLNPKMIPYLFKGKIIRKSYIKKGYHVININLTRYLLSKAKLMLESLNSANRVILFVGTKFQLKSVVAQEALRCNQFYVNYRWFGGMLTNWSTIKGQIEKLKQLEDQYAEGTLASLPIKEANKSIKKLNYLKKCLSGVKYMPRLPDVVIITHQRQDLIAVQEAKSLGIPIIGIVDTDCDPDLIDYVIPANDDSAVSVRFLLQRLGNSLVKNEDITIEG